MAEGTTTAAVHSLREQNVAHYKRIRAGEKDIPDLLGQAEELGDAVVIIECLITLAAKYEIDNDITSRVSTLSRVQSMLDSETGPLLLPVMRWALHLGEAIAAFVDCDFEDALRFCHLAELIIPHTDYDDALPSTLNMLGVLAYRVESFERSVELFAQSIAANGSTRTKAVAHTHLGTVLESQGELELALIHRQLVDGLVYQTSGGHLISDRFRFDCDHCSTLIMLGNFEEAKDRIAAIDRSRPDAQAFISVIQAERALAEGQIDEAYDFAVEAAAAFHQLGMVDNRRMAVDVQAEVLLCRGHYREAIEAITEDLASPDTIGHLKACGQLIEAHQNLEQWQEVVYYQELQRRHLEQSRIDLHSFHQVQEQTVLFEDLQAKNVALDLRNQEFELFRSDRENLLNIVAHELRSPLTALGLVLHSVEERSAAGQGFDERIQTGSRLVRRLQGLADQVATVGELTSGSFELELSVVELDDAVEQVLDEQQLSAKRKRISIMFSHCGLAVLGHRGRLEQVLTNLISNSIKFSGPRTTIMIQVANRGGSIDLSVVDQGLGLTETDLDRVFRRHAKLSARPTGGEASSGMGLYIAKQLALAMGGDLAAQSAGHGHGAVFTLTLSGVSELEVD